MSLTAPHSKETLQEHLTELWAYGISSHTVAVLKLVHDLLKMYKSFCVVLSHISSALTEQMYEEESG